MSDKNFFVEGHTFKKSLQWTARRGRIHLRLRLFWLGRDVQILLDGGLAHVGAVALAAPGQHDADALICLPGHREDQLAARMARLLAQALGCTVCVSAGVHFDNISSQEIAVVDDLAQTLTQRCLAALTVPKDGVCSQ